MKARRLGTLLTEVQTALVEMKTAEFDGAAERLRTMIVGIKADGIHEKEVWSRKDIESLSRQARQAAALARGAGDWMAGELAAAMEPAGAGYESPPPDLNASANRLSLRG